MGFDYRALYRGAVAAAAITLTATQMGCPSRDYTPREEQAREMRHQKNLNSLEREVREQMDRMQHNQNFGAQRP